MTTLTYLVTVPDQRAKDASARRVAGLLPDLATIGIGHMAKDATAATTEFTFTLGEAVELAQACLAGNERALTTPGLSRKLSATVAILFRVCLDHGAVQQQGADGDDRELAGDRDEAAVDEDPD